MDDLRKAAILLHILEEPLTADVLSYLPKNAVGILNREIAKIEEITQHEQDAVFEEFSKLAEQRTPIGGDDIAFTNNLPQQVSESDGAQNLLDQLRQSVNSAPFAFLHKAEADHLVPLIVEEHPQTIALIMAHLPATLAADVLNRLPADKQLDVVRRISSMEHTSPEVVREVEAGLESRMTSAVNATTETDDGIRKVAQILDITDHAIHRTILQSLEQENHDLVDAIRQRMFVFEDIRKLDDRAVRALLEEIDGSHWAVALRGASEAVKQRICNNLSPNAAERLEDEMESIGPVKVSHVEEMQRQIANAVRRLNEIGEIDSTTISEPPAYVS